MFDFEAVAERIVKSIDAACQPLRRRQDALETRLAALESRPLPEQGQKGDPGTVGPAGPAGPPGDNGRDGRDGRDGLGFDDLEMVRSADQRTITLRMRSGDRVKDVGTFTDSRLIYRGVFEVGRKYAAGDCVTKNGSLWIANGPTTDTPGEGQTAWTLAVKQGREGKTGPQGPKGDAGTPGRDGRDLTQLDPNTGRKF